MALCHITGTVQLPDGTNAAGRILVFKRNPETVVAQSGHGIIPDEVAVRVSADGSVDFKLYTGNYIGFLRNQRAGNERVFKFPVPEAATANFQDILQAVDPVEPLPSWLIEAFEARDEAVLAEVAAQEAADRAEAYDPRIHVYGTQYLPLVSDIMSGNPVSVLSSIPKGLHEGIVLGSSSVDVTEYIQQLISEMPSYGSMYYPRGLYNHGNILINDKSGFKLFGYGATVNLIGDGTSNGGLGFEMSGTMSDFDFYGLNIVGDGNKANMHKGLWCKSGNDLASIHVHSLNTKNLITHISMNANLSGSIDGFNIHDISIDGALGVNSGYGYGIHVAYENAGSAKGSIHSIRGVGVDRHLIYCARASNIDMWGIQSFGHRASLTQDEIDDPIDGRGRIRPAILIARSSHVRLSGFRAWDGYDSALVIACNPEGVSGVDCYDVKVSDIHLGAPKNNIPLMLVGDAQPERELEDV